MNEDSERDRATQEEEEEEESLSKASAVNEEDPEREEEEEEEEEEGSFKADAVKATEDTRLVSVHLQCRALPAVYFVELRKRVKVVLLSQACQVGGADLRDSKGNVDEF